MCGRFLTLSGGKEKQTGEIHVIFFKKRGFIAKDYINPYLREKCDLVNSFVGEVFDFSLAKSRALKKMAWLTTIAMPHGKKAEWERNIDTYKWEGSKIGGEGGLQQRGMADWRGCY